MGWADGMGWWDGLVGWADEYTRQWKLTVNNVVNWY